MSDSRPDQSIPDDVPPPLPHPEPPPVTMPTDSPRPDFAAPPPGWSSGDHQPPPGHQQPQTGQQPAPGYQQAAYQAPPGTQPPPGYQPQAGPQQQTPFEPQQPPGDQPQAQPELPPEQVGKGLLLSLLAVVGGIALTVALWRLGFIASVTSFALAAGAVWLYAKGSGAGLPRVSRG